MNVVDASGLNYMLDYDSTGFINPVYNGYLAPTENFEFGCGFEFACNYNPCALYDFDLCEFLDVMVETTVDNGSGDGTATAKGEVGSEDSFTDGISVDSLLAGDYSVLAVDSTGCIGTTDFVIDAIDGITQPGAVWHVFPNPASDIVQVNLSTPGRGELTLTDLGGREVMSTTLNYLRTTLDLGTLPAGTYVPQFKQKTKLYTRNLHVIR
ncbi:MAG: T9SS type A sorting domain-containing protein [Bacteroidota bacterium]|nr:T9SS type A sorting domain-containing protein [Bacteroidota bacterium]